MNHTSVVDVLASLEAEHAKIIKVTSKVNFSVQRKDGDARKEVIKLEKLLRNHFLREDMELFPLAMRHFKLQNKHKKPVNLFESDRERNFREHNSHATLDSFFWDSAYNDRDFKSELISFAKITLQVFGIIKEYIECPKADQAAMNAKMLGVLHILDARIDYEENELFPKIRNTQHFPTMHFF